MNERKSPGNTSFFDPFFNGYNASAGDEKGPPLTFSEGRAFGAR